MALHALILNISLKELLALICLLLQDRNYVTVKNRVLFPEFRGRMVSFELEVLNLLFVGMKIPVLLLYYVVNIQQKKTSNDVGYGLAARIFGINILSKFFPC